MKRFETASHPGWVAVTDSGESVIYYPRAFFGDKTEFTAHACALWMQHNHENEMLRASEPTLVQQNLFGDAS